jgi:hypothetical protein
MAEAFEDRLYVLIAELGEPSESLERFKARGDAAFLFDELEVDPDDLEAGLFALMAEFGVALPSEEMMTQGTRGDQNGQWVLKNFTIGELKQTVVLGKWQDDAWSYRRYTFWQQFGGLVQLAIILLLLLIAVVLGLMSGFAHKPA